MDSPLSLQPIGFVSTQKQVKFQARHQPSEQDEERNLLELLPGSNFEQALQDLAGFERIWLVWWFHRNASWRPQVLPPRGPSRRRGVFATRSPHRPNPLGITPVRLISVERRRLIIGPCDLVDGTPVLDIKPYIPAYDSFPDSRAGWIDEIDEELRAPPAFTVTLNAFAQAQADWLKAGWAIDFLPRLFELLSRDPTPHRTRRIRRRATESSEIGCGAWRAVFVVRENTVEVTSLEPAYPLRFLLRQGYEDVPDREAQLAFLERWPEPPSGAVG